MAGTIAGLATIGIVMVLYLQVVRPECKPGYVPQIAFTSGWYCTPGYFPKEQTR